MLCGCWPSWFIPNYNKDFSMPLHTKHPSGLDPILIAFQDFMADPRAEKINLSVGMCYDEDGRIPLMKAVAQAQQTLAQRNQPWGYLMGEGLPALRENAARMLLSDELFNTLQPRLAVFQTLGGTGAVRLGAELAGQLWPTAPMALSQPTWINHPAILQAAKRQVMHYPYYDSSLGGVNFDAMLQDLEGLPKGALVVLHGCCHNPTGADLSTSQWEILSDRLLELGLRAFVDVAYAGFGEGLEGDLAPVRLLARKGVPLLIALSFSKSFALYGERVGALIMIAEDSSQAEAANDFLKGVTRTLYSTPPSHGAMVVSEILADPALTALWRQELEDMRVRIHGVRGALLEALGAGPYDFSCLVRQKGLFSYTGLSAEQVHWMKTEHAVHAVSDGRICMAAINRNNIQRVAEAMRGAARI